MSSVVGDSQINLIVSEIQLAVRCSEPGVVNQLTDNRYQMIAIEDGYRFPIPIDRNR